MRMAIYNKVTPHLVRHTVQSSFVSGPTEWECS